MRRSSPFTGRTMMTPKMASSFVEAITDAGLDGLLDALQRAGVTTLISLKKHDIAELEASLRRPHVKLGSTYSLSRVEVQSFIELGVKPSRTTPNADGGAGALPDVFSMAAHTLGAAASAAPLTLTTKTAPTAALYRACHGGETCSDERASPQHSRERRVERRRVRRRRGGERLAELIAADRELGVRGAPRSSSRRFDWASP